MVLLENLPDAVYFKDRQSRFVRFSQSFGRLFKLMDPTVLEGKTDFDFFSEEHARPAYNDEQEIMRTGTPVVGKVEKETHMDGRVTWALTSKMPWRNSRGEIVGTFGVSKDITAMKETELKVERLHKQLLESSREAGMAEVATSVLHNVGNVLNSINVSVSLLVERLRVSKHGELSRVLALLPQEQGELGEFLARNPKGQKVMPYLQQFAGQLARHEAVLLEELNSVAKNVAHINTIIAMQQNYARVAGVAETVRVEELVEDALRFNGGALARHQIEIIRQYEPGVPELVVDKHKVLQVLVNLISNAKYACDQSPSPNRQLTVNVTSANGRIKIAIADNGIGIAPENLTRIFNLGFTTRKGGHGFGLHSSALAAQEIGGTLTAASPGIGQGAAFTLDLPLVPELDNSRTAPQPA